MKTTKEFLEVSARLGLPLGAGISGTLDQSTTMAAICGLVNSEADLENIRLAVIACMVPNEDHTVHEILQSSKSFGAAYDASPCMYEKVLSPHVLGEGENQAFADQVKQTLGAEKVKALQELVGETVE